MNSRLFRDLLGTTSVVALLALPVSAYAFSPHPFVISGSTGGSVTIPSGTTFTRVYATGNPSIGGSIINDGTIAGAVNLNNGTYVGVANGTNIGAIINNGTIIVNSKIAVVITSQATVEGGITNFGSISNAAGAGIGIFPTGASGFTVFSGGITNSGTISVADLGIFVGTRSSPVPTFSGGITNSGTISGEPTGLLLSNVATFMGGIINSGSIFGSGVGIRIGTSAGEGVSTFTGGITNNGTISGNYGIAIDNVTSFSNGVINNDIISASGPGIVIANDQNVSGGVTNSGTVSAIAQGINIVTVSTFTGGVSNSGLISSNGVAVQIGTGGSTTSILTFSGGITNSGTLTAAGRTAVTVSQVSTFTGGIVNTANATLAGGGGPINGGAILLSNVSTFSGGIINAGQLFSVGQSAILVSNLSSFDGGITNSGTISISQNDSIPGSGVGIAVGTNGGAGVGIFTGGITNSGSITPLNKTGILVTNVSAFSGGIINSTGGVLSGGPYGIQVGNLGPTTVSTISVSTFSGGIANSGILTATRTGIGVFQFSTFGGGISNSGTLSAAQTGISVSRFSAFSGGITNSGMLFAPADGVSVSHGTLFSGNIVNDATLSGGVFVGLVSTFSGGVVNSAAATLNSGSDNFAILLFDDLSFTGGISNAGLILSPNPHTAITLSGGSNFGGGISNTGTISASGVAIHVGVSSFTGGIANSGTLSAAHSDIVIAGVSMFSGGIVNSAGATLAAADGSVAAILLSNVSTFAGGITNAGSIAASTGILVEQNSVFLNGIVNNGVIFGRNGIQLGANTDGGPILGISTFSGGITNTGTISVRNSAIAVLNVPSFSGGITNSGTINGRFGITVGSGSTAAASVSSFSGGITNSGVISVTRTGIAVNNVGSFSGSTPTAGGIVNTNTIMAGGRGIIVDGTEFTDGGSSFSGGITNTGLISAAASGIQVTNISIFSGGVTNNGTILGRNGIHLGGTNLYTYVSGGVSTFSGGITNTGTISAANIGIWLQNTPSVSIFDFGTITGASGTAIQFSSGVNTLTLGQGFVINGNVIGAGTDLLQLGGSGAGAFDLKNIGTQYTGFATFSVTGATWIATNTNANNWSISSGATLQLGNGTTSGLITGSYTDSGTLAFDEPSTTTIASMISGTGSVAQMGPGTVVLSGTNAYSGGTMISAGTLQVTNDSSVGSGSVTLAGGTFQAGATGLVFSNAFVFSNGSNTIDTQSNTLTLSGPITGTGSLVKIGAGTLTLMGTGGYTGATNVSAGTLQAGAAGVFTGSAYTVAAGATLDLNSFNQTIGSLSGAGGMTLGSATLTTGNDNTSTTYAGTISGAGGLTKTGSGVFTLSGTSSYTGATGVSAGTLQAGAAGAFAGSSAYTVASGAVLDLNSFNQAIGSLAGSGSVTLGSATLTTGNDNTSTTYAGTISGTGELVKVGSGTLTLTGTNSYSGGTLLDAGTLAIGSSGALGTGALIVASGAVLELDSAQATGSLTGNGNITLGSVILTIGGDNTSTTYAGTISGTGGVAKIGGGTLSLSGASSYTGVSGINTGTLQADAVNAFGASSAYIVAAGATLDLNSFNQTIGSLSGSGSVTLGSATLSTGNDNTSTTYAGTISGTGGLTKIGSGTLTVSGTSSYTGTSDVNVGMLQAGAANTFAGSSDFTVAAGAVLDLNSFSQTIGSLSGSGSVTLGSATLTTGNDNASTTYTGTISGTGGLVKVGSGAFTLSGTSSYSGGTAVDAGTLTLGGSGALGTGGVMVAPGAVLDLSGFNQAIGSLSGSGNLALTSATLTTGSDGTSTNYAGAISGSGSLVKTGAGTLTLSGASSYTGGTTLSAGGLTLGNGNALGTGALAVAAGTTLGFSAGNFTFANNIAISGAPNFAPAAGTTQTINGVISDGSSAGTLAMQGPGTLVLTGANTYSGGTTLRGGTLGVGSNNALGTGGVALADGTMLQAEANGLGLANTLTLNGAGTIDTQNNSLTLSGTISGGGSLVKIGAGTLSLPAANSYTGGTTLTAGALTIGNSNALGSGVLAMAAGTTLGFSGGNLTLANNVTVSGDPNFAPAAGTTQTITGVISDGSSAGTLAMQGPGALVLTGANTYSGGTTLNAGTLTIANGNALGTGTLAMADGTTLQAAISTGLPNAITLGGAGTVDTQSYALTLSGNISGSGSLVKIGAGFLTLSGMNSYTGGTSVLAGTLIGTTTSLQGNILDNATVVFDQAAAGTYSGSLSGSGALTIHGAGTVTFTGNSSGFTGETRIAGGALAVGTLASPNGSLGGTIDVYSGGMLSGHGAVGTVNNLGGTVMPGGSIGTLTIVGNYTQNSAGTLLVQLTPTASSQLNITGTAVLGGALTLAYSPGTYSPRTYTFVAAPTVTGGFNSVTTMDAPDLGQGLNINPSTGQIILGSGFTVAPTNDTIFPAIASTLIQNSQQADSLVLDRLASRLNGTNADNTSLASLSGGPAMQLAQIGGGNLGAIKGIATALPEAIAERGAWFRGVGSFGSTNGNNTAPGYDTDSGGFLAGFDQPVRPDLVVGIAGGYTHSNVDEHSTSSGNINTARLQLYGGGLVGSALWEVTAGYAHDSLSSQRGLTGIGDARASYGANEFTLAGQASLPFEIGDTTVTPQAGVRAVRLFESGFTETGASGSDLAGTPDSLTSVQPFVGASASRVFVTDSGIQITPDAQIGYARELASNERDFGVNATDGTPFVVQGIGPSRDILTAGAGVKLRVADNVYVYADYDAVLPTGNNFNQTFSGGVHILFPPYAQTPSNETLAPEPAPVSVNEPELSEADRAALLAKQQELFDHTLRDPGNLDVIYDYATVSARVGDNEAAVEALERMLLFNPKLPASDIELGVLYYRMGSFKVAQSYLDTASTLNPTTDEQARITEYTTKIAEAQQLNAFSAVVTIGAQYQSDANVAPGSGLVHSPIGDVLLNTQFIKHEDSDFFAIGSFLYSYDLGTQAGDAIEFTGTGFGNHYLQFNRLDLDFGEVTVGPRLRFPDLAVGPLESASFKPFLIFNEVGLGEHQYFWTYGTGAEATAVLWKDVSAKLVYEFRQKIFTNAPDRPLSTGLDGNDNLVTLSLSKPITANSDAFTEFDYVDQSTRFNYYANNTYSVGGGYRVRYDDPTKLLRLPWETAFFGSRTWSIYEGPDPCCSTSGNPANFSPSARDERHWRFGITQTFPVNADMAFVAQLQRDIVSSNLSIYGYTSNSFLVDAKIRF